MATRTNEPAKDGQLPSANDLDLVLYPLLEKAGGEGVHQDELGKACGKNAHQLIGRLSDLLEAGILTHPMKDDGSGDDLRRFALTKGGQQRYKDFYSVAVRRAEARKPKQTA